MVARVLSEFGIFLGADLACRTSEDREVKDYVKRADEAGFERFCRLRDAEHRIWGFTVKIRDFAITFRPGRDICAIPGSFSSSAIFSL